MAKIIRLTENDLVRLISKVISEDANTESSKSKLLAAQSLLDEMGFKKVPGTKYYSHYFSKRPETKPNLTCEIRWDWGPYKEPYIEGQDIIIKFNRVVQKAEGYWSGFDEGQGPIPKLKKMMQEEYDMKGITTLSAYRVKDIWPIITLYDQIKFQ